MSSTLFTNANEALEQLESVLQVKLKKYSLTLGKDRLNVHPKPKDFYHAHLVFTRRDDNNGYISVDGESFPDLFQKIAAKL